MDCGHVLVERSPARSFQREERDRFGRQTATDHAEGEGARELAEAVVEACEEKSDFEFLYSLDIPVKDRIEIIAREVYGAKGVSYSKEAEDKLKIAQEDPEMRKLGTCMVKTHLSLSHDPSIKGRPTDWILPVRDVQAFMGAGFLVPIAGDIKLMPGMASDPAFRGIDVDVNTGKVQGRWSRADKHIERTVIDILDNGAGVNVRIGLT